ncbi:hypothetical protein psyc5s11_04600 [Clostridium gelidum]|uniref:Polysaccharide biosynthesis protein C-terminal domain-containing protein n=1 Tax=Clostridium gelidum TaxID=704125 RepID=A0ABM7SXS4_9CLOT|nr:hypothetical protein [Clostridium gelidum]BCZ44393.1 hypothetical protein psyc5s11_04600 [Clostridium gelidum]
MDLGAYAIAQKAIFIISTLMLTIIQVTMPRLSNDLGTNSKKNYFALLNKVVKIYFLLLFPAAMGLLCVSKQVMWIFDYKDASYISWYPLLFIPITFVINHFVDSMIISCGLDVIACGLLYLGILLITKDVIFFEVYDRAVTKLKALI